jgi:hypothetical protein
VRTYRVAVWLHTDAVTGMLGEGDATVPTTILGLHQHYTAINVVCRTS